MELGEVLEVDMIRVHEAVCDQVQVQAKERYRVSGAVGEPAAAKSVRCGRRSCSGNGTGGGELFARAGGERH